MKTRKPGMTEMGKRDLKDAIRILRTVKNFPTYFADSFQLGKQKYFVVILRNGIKYRIRSGTLDRWILREIWMDRIYTPKEFEINEKDMIIDIGAHIGVFSIFASTFAKRGRIYAFEPIAENFEMLKRNVEINKIKNIIPVNRAISDKRGQKRIFLSENTGGHSFYFGKEKTKKTEIETISLEHVIEQRDLPQIDFLKVDCEGAEYEILFGCSDKMLRLVMKISMEYHNIDDNRNVFSLKTFLEKRGFEIRVKYETRARGMLYAKR